MSFQPFALHVVELDRPDDGRRLEAGVVVRAGGMVDEREPKVSAYCGCARRIVSSAFHPLRGTICGSPAAETVLNGIFETGLRTVSARARVTRPIARTSTPAPRPTHTGAPSRHPRVARASRLAGSGASPSSSRTRLPRVQPPRVRMRNSSRPGPCQWIPTSWNGLVGLALRASADHGAALPYRSVASPADAAAGSARATQECDEEATGHRGENQRDAARLLRQPPPPFPDGMLTAELRGKGPLLESNRRGRAPRASARISPRGGRRRATPRVALRGRRPAARPRRRVPQRRQSGDAGVLQDDMHRASGTGSRPS